jgi:hypothetical protein
LRGAIGGKPIGYTYKAPYEARLPAPKSLWFTEENTIAATFVVRDGESSTKLPRREDANLPLRLQVEFLDATTGRIKAKANWPSESAYALIVAAHDGKFITQTGSRFTLYGPDLTEFRKITMPPLQGYWHWFAVASPTMKNMLLYSGQEWYWIDTDNLQILHSWQEALKTTGMSITDDKLAVVRLCDRANCDLQIRGLSTPWVVIGSIPGRPASSLDFLNNGLLFIGGPAVDPARLLRSDGQVATTLAQPGKRDAWWGKAVLSTEGKRFVAPGIHLEGSHPSLDIGGHNVLKQILAYDLTPGGRHYVLDVKGPRIKGEMKFALSPDGTRLAVLNNETVEVFDLPPVQ